MTAVSQVWRRTTRRTSYRQGFKEGYRQGVRAGGGQFGTGFEGTSIIIPTYNQLPYLKKCLESIEKYTESSYEIVVVDNGSTDGTGDYLESLGGLVRFRVLERNMGFAGAVNAGLMMAKGRTIVLLNNDTIVTDKWLRNLLYCLESDPSIGMVGPVTNFISGDQRIRVPYRKLEEMPAFARKHNHRRPADWQDTEWLRGFCLLFRRELFEEIGYFDEGFEMGNFEDNDYNLRVRLTGRRLVIARDTFIHHYGSVTIKALGDSFSSWNQRNEIYYKSKWEDPLEWMQHARLHLHADPAAASQGMAGYFPEWVAVQGTGGTVYWIEGGLRHRVDGELSFPAVRLSQVDLRRWPVGEPVASGLAEKRWRGLEDAGGWGASVAVLPDGSVYHLEGKVARRIVSLTAFHSWRLHFKPARMVVGDELADRSLGMPIIALPILKQSL